ncbi:MAG: protein translocase subunit SecD [Deltaproteobacteria bacterium]|nr:protein translocase subunit SecD [Deltaproteobacteria bacterium]
MTDSWKWKAIATLAAILAALYILVPSVFDLKSAFFPKKTINLGLDLRGGMYLEMDVDLKEALENRIDILLVEVERVAKDKAPGLKLTRIPGNLVSVEMASGNEATFAGLLQENFGDIFEKVEGAAVHTLKLTETYVSHIHEMTVKQAEEAVRNRIDRYGVAEASINRQGSDRLIVELPGVKDPERVIDIIRKTGLLEFKLVDESVDQGQLSSLVAKAREEAQIQEGYDKLITEKINQALAGKISDDSEILFELERDPVTKEVIQAIPYLLKKRADVTGDMLRNAQVGIQNNEPYVALSFNKIGTKNFGEITKANVGKRLAIVLDGLVNTAPVIQGAIPNGEAQITLGFGSYDSLMRQAEDLALMLREGALPASLTVATKTVIGPSLGADSIKKGLNSILLSTLVVVIFMMAYYKLGGILADVALVLNVLFIFSILALFQASLTLPGIAGIVLTMGMAVDANVIIFERMREEKRLGKTPKAIVDSGYSHAMSAIIDGNLTTLIAGIVLFQFGTGPIKGFATTLMIGILTTMFTAVVFTRLVYDYFIFKRKVGRLVI